VLRNGTVIWGRILCQYGRIRIYFNDITVRKRPRFDRPGQLTLMVHITKMEIQVWLAVLLFMKIEGLFVHTSLTQQLEQWKYIVLKTINHPRVSSNKKIAMRVRVMKVRIVVWCHSHPFTNNLSDMGLSNNETKSKFTYLKS